MNGLQFTMAFLEILVQLALGVICAVILTALLKAGEIQITPEQGVKFGIVSMLIPQVVFIFIKSRLS